jgi:deferrochelatase/peroxidase EfeB
MKKGLTRRAMLASAGGAAGVGIVAGRYGLGEHPPAGASTAWPFDGHHQSGIATPQQAHLCFAAFDLAAESAADLQQLLRAWSTAGRRLCTGGQVTIAPGKERQAPDPGEAAGLQPAGLTLTFGLGPGLFERAGQDRLGLRPNQPKRLAQLPPLPGDELQRERSYGDLCIQACADDPQVAFHAIHVLALEGRGVVVPRWIQHGFLPGQAAADAPRTEGASRNLMGFKDGTNNIRSADGDAMKRHVWVPDGQAAPRWLRGGTYLVARRIRMLLDVWDGLTLAQQEQIIGRHKRSGAPLGGDAETDAPDLKLRRHGNSVIEADAHIRLAARSENDGIRILRRGYSYSDGVDQASGQIDAGLFFICFQRDPRRQFAALQTRLGESDALAKHISHTSSAVFACPSGTRPGEYVAQGLFA